MPSLANYKKQLGSHSLGEARKIESNKIYEASWYGDITAKTAYIYDFFHDDEPLIFKGMHPEKSKTKCPIDIKFIINSYNSESKDEVGKHIQFKPSFDWRDIPKLSYYKEFEDKYGTEYPLSLYLDIYDDTLKAYRKWLCVEFANTLGNQFPTWYILPCDHLFQWVSGGIKYQMCGVSRSQNSYNSGVWQNRGGAIQLTMPENQRVCVLPMNEISSTIFYDQRIAISSPVKTPVVWKCSKVDNTNPKGLVRLTFAQERWDEHNDAFEYEHIDGLTDFSNDYDSSRKVIGIYADYYSSTLVPKEVEIENTSNIYGTIIYKAKPQLKIGGGNKKFTIVFLDGDEEIDLIPGSWSFELNGESISDLVEYKEEGNVLSVKFLGDDSYIGSIIKITYTTSTGIITSVDVEIIGL